MSIEGYKIDVTPYIFETKSEVITKDGKFEIDPDTGEPRLEIKFIPIDTKLSLSLMITNSNIGSQNGQPPPGFDLYDLGVIAKRIEQADDSVILNQDEYEKLKARVNVVSKFLNFKFFEMVRRVREAERVRVSLEEKK